MTTQRFDLVDPASRQAAMRAIAQAADGMRCEIRPATRGLAQNALLHALFADIARQTGWCGRTLSPHQWKVLMMSGHAMATGRGADMVPGIEGEFVNIRESSASMSVARMTSLIEYVLAWCAARQIATTVYDAAPEWVLREASAA